MEAGDPTRPLDGVVDVARIGDGAAGDFIGDDADDMFFNFGRKVVAVDNGG